ncbi:MAG TPA: hypothetical protein VGM11_06910, partial [Acidobacteriaceae bacterium]
MHRSAPRAPRALPAILLPLLAAIAIAPLIVHGCSCGADFEFHLQSWLDAAAQMRHGTLSPAWTISAAWNAGEPRFLFYPPLSWMLGALLALTVPISAAPIFFTGIALLGAATAMYLLVRDYVSVPIALLAAAVYIANPYLLFTALERTAYGELLAAIWMPLLLRAALRRVPGIAALAMPLALLWLTNAPAAVIGTYALLLIGVIRVGLAMFVRRTETSRALTLLLRFSCGGALGLALLGFYLLPAAYERRYVQVAMAIIPNMRVEDNFLFGHTGDAPHDRVLHEVSAIAVVMLIATLIALVLAFAARREQRSGEANNRTASFPILATLAAAITLLLTPVSLPLWNHVPELAFLQFPWRMLSMLGVILALAVALALRRVPSTRNTLAIASVLSLLTVAAMTAWEMHGFRQPCEALDQPAARAQLFVTHHGVEPTDEYTPTNADNDVLRWDNPAWWLASDAAAFAPNTVPNPAAAILNYDVPPPVDQTVSGIAPHHLQLKLDKPRILIFNLRDYPSWQVLRNRTLVPQHLRRDDGL